MYLRGPEADAVHDAGLTGAVRQMPAPVTRNPRWPADRRIGKIAVGRERLMDRSADEMAARMRREMSVHATGGRVALDEIAPAAWTPAQAARFARAMRLLGDDARRVVVYASGSFVERVGRTDPRRPLSTLHRRLIAGMARAGAVYLQTYRGGWRPIEARALATSLARWSVRWPAGARARLGLAVGPSTGIGQPALWARLRAGADGRRMLKDGVAVVGGSAMDRAEVDAWITEYRTFLAAPDQAPAAGDIPVARVGRPTLNLPRGAGRGAPVLVGANRPGRAVVRLLPLTGARRGDARVIAALGFSRPGTRATRMPTDIRAGRYRLILTFQGEGTRERVTRPARIAPRR